MKSRLLSRRPGWLASHRASSPAHDPRADAGEVKELRLFLRYRLRGVDREGTTRRVRLDREGVGLRRALLTDGMCDTGGVRVEGGELRKCLEVGKVHEIGALRVVPLIIYWRFGSCVRLPTFCRVLLRSI